VGQLRIRVSPPAAVFLDNNRQGTGISTRTFTLPVATHNLRISHAIYGIWSCDVPVDADTLFDLSVDLKTSTKVTVVAQDEASGQYLPGAAITIDGIPRDFTPKTFELLAGLHKIEVRHDGYETTSVAPESPGGCYQVRGDNINFDPNAIDGMARVVARLRPVSNP
jgi:hypothetical protein